MSVCVCVCVCACVHARVLVCMYDVCVYVCVFVFIFFVSLFFSPAKFISLLPCFMVNAVLICSNFLMRFSFYMVLNGYCFF